MQLVKYICVAILEKFNCYIIYHLNYPTFLDTLYILHTYGNQNVEVVVLFEYKVTKLNMQRLHRSLFSTQTNFNQICFAHEYFSHGECLFVQNHLNYM